MAGIMHLSRHLGILAFVLACGTMSGQSLAAEETGDVAVRVEIQGDIVRVDVETVVAATSGEVWDVLTDFEHLPRFISNITSSKVLSRDGNLVKVSQAGKTKVGPLTFEFQSVRELTLTPLERLESRMLSGNMKRFHGTTRIDAIEGKTRIRFQSEAVPDTWLPLSLARPSIEAETREHFQDIRKEVLRRKSAAAEK
jgi:uncharacterized membrane protein